ncbi:MAG: hypothetical protein E7564_03845 [Ruminococcaceae bacterium]|nr:hypothetical protein [Oscillospiraceae bacterium]
MNHLTILEGIKESLISSFPLYDVRFSFCEADTNSLYLKPCIVLDGVYSEKEEDKELKIKATLCVSREGDLFSSEITAVFEFITNLVKTNFPSVLSVYLSDVQNIVSGKFKKRALEITVVPTEIKESYIGGKSVSLPELIIYKESESKPLWQMCDKEPVAYIGKKNSLVGKIQNCSIERELLEGKFDIEYEGKILKGCTLIYAKGEENIHEAKFYIGSIE